MKRGSRSAGGGRTLRFGMLLVGVAALIGFSLGLGVGWSERRERGRLLSTMQDRQVREDGQVVATVPQPAQRSVNSPRSVGRVELRPRDIPASGARIDGGNGTIETTASRSAEAVAESQRVLERLWGTELDRRISAAGFVMVGPCMEEVHRVPVRLCPLRSPAHGSVRLFRFPTDELAAEGIALEMARGSSLWRAGNMVLVVWLEGGDRADQERLLRALVTSS